MSAEQLIDIATSFHGVLVVDEAYVDFVDPEQQYDLTSAIKEYENLLILRTLSKGYSLAGLRFGYGIGAAAAFKALSRAGCQTFFVATVDEAITLAGLKRQYGYRARIICLNGPATQDAASAMLTHHIEPALNSPGQVELWTKCLASSAFISTSKTVIL